MNASVKTWVPDASDKHGAYQLLIDGQVAGHLALVHSSMDQRAALTLRQKAYSIRQTGFWRGVTEMRDADNLPVATIKAEKWYSSTYRLEYRGRVYRLVIRNSPHLEWAILDQERTLLGYGLSVEKGRHTLQIRSEAGPVDPELDALLWYLLLPSVLEDTDGSFLLTVV